MNVSQQIIYERLKWVEDVRENLLFILEDKMDPVIHVIPTVDPLKLILKISLRRPLAKGSREPIRVFMRACAAAHGCELPIIRMEDNHIQAEVLIEERHWQRDRRGQFTGPRRFERGPR